MTTDKHQETGVEPSPSRLPEATRLGPVHLQVADLARSLSFYEEILGLQVVDRSDDRRVLGPQDTNTPLIVLVEQPGARAAPRRGRLGLFHVALLLPSRGALGQFVRHLSEEEIEVGMSDHGVSEAIYLTDPDGLGIEVYADRPSDEWEHTDTGELSMGTEPLDAQDVLDAAPTAPWTGMPRGTTVGHVHLHVGSLEEAEAFYHEALGLDKTVWSYPGALFLAAGGYHHHVGTNVWAGDAPPAAENEARLLEWTLVVPDPGDVEATAQRLAAEGFPVTRDDGTCRTQDPWGTTLRIAPAP